MINPQFKLSIAENGNLIISCEAEDRLEIREFSQEHGEMDTILEFTEHYWTNGWGVHSADELGNLSEAPLFAEESTIEDDGSIVLGERVWYHPNYQIESLVDTVLQNGFIELPLLD